MTTSSWQALGEFARADRAWAGQNSNAALLHLHAALDLDPGFALASARTGDILTSLNRADEALPYYQSAANLIRSRNLTDRESLRIRGIFLLDTWQNDEAGRVFERWALEYPRDPIPLFYRATVLDRAGRFEEALALGRYAVELDPARAVFVEAQAERLLNMGRATEACAEATRFAALDPSSPWSEILTSALSLAGMNLHGAWSPLERLSRTNNPRFRSLGYTFQVCFRAEQKRWTEAENLCSAALDWDLAHGLLAEQFVNRRQLVQILLRQDRKKEAAALCKQILAEQHPSDQQSMEIGCLLAQAGDPDQATKCLRPNLPSWPRYLHWSNRLRAEIAVARGDSANGLALMKQMKVQPVGIWREEVLNAALAAGDRNAAESCLGDLFSNPGRAWRTAWFIGPGFLFRAAEISQQFSLPEPQRKTAEWLRKAFATKMEV